MGYFPVRYNSRVVNYDRRGFIRLATGLQVCTSVSTIGPKQNILAFSLYLSFVCAIAEKIENKRKIGRGWSKI